MTQTPEQLDVNKRRQALQESINEDIICPFCGEKDFDLIGLKYHLKWYCEVYSNTEDLHDPLYRK